MAKVPASELILPLRNYAVERQRASARAVERIAVLREARDTGILGDEVIKMAQALILCTLPYRPTSERQVMRSARLSDGSTLRVTFTAGLNGVDMPFGADRNLMAWLFDRAIASDSPFVTIRNASEYLRETGRSRSGKRVKELAGRLRRLSGLVIGIERRASGETQTMMLPMIETSNLPENLSSMMGEEGPQPSLPGMGEQFGIQLEERFFADIKRYHVAVPRRLWLQLQEAGGTPQLQDLLTFFVYRCYSAQSETVIPWKGLREQFPQDDSNPRRLKQNVLKAVKHLKVLWPEAKVEVLEEGVQINRSTYDLLPEDASRNRQRKLS